MIPSYYTANTHDHDVPTPSRSTNRRLFYSTSATLTSVTNAM